MLKTTVGQTSERKQDMSRKHMRWIFCVCAHACYWGQDGMKMKRSPVNSTKRCTSKGVLYLPYLPSWWSCIRQSFHVILIFSITWSLGPSPQILGSDLNMSPFPILTEWWISAISMGSDSYRDEAMGGLFVQFLHARPTWKLGQNCIVLRHKTLLLDGGPERTPLCSFWMEGS